MGLVLDSLTGKVARSNIRRATQLHCRNSCRYRMSSPAGSKRKRQNQLVSPVMVAAQEAPPKATQELKLRTFDSKSLDKAQLSNILTRPRIDFDSILHTVQPIVQAVKERGDQAVRQFTEKFDRVQLDVVCSRIEDFPEPELSADTVAAFETAFNNIHRFHTAQKQTIPLQVETMPGVQCRRLSKAIGAVGIYVPGGTAVLPSSALMLSVPAGIAGCKTIVLATPPRPDGTITPEVLWCAKRAGVTHILKAGGAQAVAAMAWGTETCPKVYKILGPGNQYVTAAKMALQNSEAMISMDMPAGPSEVLVIADAAAPAAHVAADLLSQAEHGPDSQFWTPATTTHITKVVLLALPGVDLEAVNQEVAEQCAALPRSDAASQALSHSCVVSVGSKQEAADLSNLYAPEHLIINVEDAEDWLPLIDNAGSVFLGRWTPESVGDYASGTNHVLPTYGYARMYSGVSLDSFQKGMTVQNLSKQGLQNLGPTVAHMADLEGLTAHQRAVTMRLKDLQ